MTGQIANAATEKQYQYIVSLAAQKDARVRRESDAARVVGMTTAQWGRMTKIEASRIIDSLKK
jgi:hypothetical protein